MFLPQVWRLVVPPGDESWVEHQLKTREYRPGGTIVAPPRRLTNGGASIADLNIVVSVMQWILLFQLCHLLSDPGDAEEEVKNID